ncbi:hypothetical protein DZF92_03130 [Clavibacter michiganensis subsp. insidiosus]|uniref:Uncharacterized protein n=1 Tax=Clavibacter michiganensis subsp. insidiosus TaxID=33014 RepID=A0A399N2R1_9MICO|nr:hypothetical protein [Clavibacter michiganensis]AWG01496.1 hypothetical protein BEH62_07810 [Clavibacter michiganensis subsp. insidiosus]OQJ59971.1 hypothetical protein B5P21_08650 [Clavibacter michiganensis subsp. insidiosus]RII88415.1 hypothetical protein DZF92_03130 [Clavibacter michiganensis subsp. insidiosus]RIJ44377.1 hypothetical protein DZF93_03045 [Clavibacter michiganensis subsp. insidiosus]RMC88800.1 hypothetical protein CmiCFBP2404_00835 [Clavibacter michiganensis subsp. insidio
MTLDDQTSIDAVLILEGLASLVRIPGVGETEDNEKCAARIDGAAQAVIRDTGIATVDLDKARQEAAAEWDFGMIFALMPGDEVLRFCADLLRRARRSGETIFTAEPDPPKTERW